MLTEEYPGQFVYKMISVKNIINNEDVESHLVGKRFYSVNLFSGKFQLKFVDQPGQLYTGKKVQVTSRSDNGLNIGIFTRTLKYEMRIVGGYGLEGTKKQWHR